MGITNREFSRLFKDHHPTVYRYVRFRVDDDQAAEDLTAEVFERAFRYRDSYDPNRASFSTWIGHIAHNWVNNYVVGRGRRSSLELELNDEQPNIDEAQPEQRVVFKDTVSRLMACLELLNDRERQIVSLRFVSEMRNKAIAELMGLKERTLSVVLMRALQRLRGCQEEQ